MIVALDGGLGNQMFQYCFGRSLSIQRNEELFFYKNFTVRAPHLPQRSYQLDAFNVDVKFADKLSEPVIHDYAFSYNPEAVNAPRGASFVGWWQSEKYFNGPIVEPIIRKELTLRNPPSDQTLRLFESIKPTKSAFIHVRRGDYTTPEGLAWHGVCSKDYYLRGIETIRQEQPGVRFFVFSDDQQFCKDWFADLNLDSKPKAYMTFVEHNLDRPWEDLDLMSFCNHAIIANSTFSWWGAWLGEWHENRIVIGPNKWFTGAGLNSQDILPERWLKYDD